MDQLNAQSDRLATMLGRFFDSETVGGILALAAPAVRLTTIGSDDGPPLKTTRFGGTPVLPSGRSWPRWGRRPLRFLGVVDFGELAEVTGVPGLPEAATAGFYYAAEIPWAWGDDPAESDGWRVLPAAKAAMEGVSAPAGVVSTPEVMPRASPFVSLPGPAEPALRGIGDGFGHFHRVYGEVYRAWLRYVWSDQLPGHQLAGWPVLLGRPIWDGSAQPAAGRRRETPVIDASAEAADQWRLLLQLCCDDRLGWSWGDAGCIYFSVRTAQPAGSALEQSRLTLQSR